MKTVNVPIQLRKLTEGAETVKVAGNTLLEVIIELDKRFPGVKERVINSETHSLNKFILFFVNDEDVRFLQNENTPLKDGDVISIVPALAGG